MRIVKAIILSSLLTILPVSVSANSLEFRTGVGSTTKQQHTNYYSLSYAQNISDLSFLIKKTELGYYHDLNDKNSWTLRSKSSCH